MLLDRIFLPAPELISFTGADDNTDPAALVALQRQYPRAEWAILLYPPKTGEPLYPRRDWINHFLSRVGAAPRALHLCGSAIHDFLRGESEVCTLARRFSRVQLNFFQQTDPVDAAALQASILSSPVPVIVPFNAGNKALVETLHGPQLRVLFDASGGNGRLPGEWPTALPKRVCGYAGGLGPETINAELPRIIAAAGGQPYWIDMEKSLREKLTNRFSLERVGEVLRRVSQICEKSLSLAGADS